MSDYDNTNRGQIWPNDRKDKDTHPDFKGSQLVECPHCQAKTDYWISAWKRKEGANPKAPSLSWSVQTKEQSSVHKTQPTEQPKDHATEGPNDFDDIPF